MRSALLWTYAIFYTLVGVIATAIAIPVLLAVLPVIAGALNAWQIVARFKNRMESVAFRPPPDFHRRAVDQN